MSRCLPPCKIRYIGYSRDYRSLACAVSSRSIWTTSRCLQFTSAYNDGGTPNSPPLPLSKRDGWVPTIGLELHVQLKSPIKLFSSSKTSHDEIPNSNVSSYDAALPGTLPILNPEPVKLAILAALALGCRVNLRSKFDRKHYFYHDLPAGFQITQKYAALANHGQIELSPRHDNLAYNTKVRISQVQLEQDTAKSMNDPTSASTLVDLNRAGTGLIEIISEADMHTSAEAAAYVRKVQSLLRAVGASDANMEKGSLRIDVNVSVARTGQPMGTRCEIKNLNSVRSMVDAIEYEYDRHIAVLSSPAGTDASPQVEQQTRGFDATDGTTHLLRSKADAPDYRYMPDPELAPLVVPSDVLNELQASLPDLPDAVRARLESQFGLGSREVDIIVRLGQSDTDGASDTYGAGVAYFEQLAQGRDPIVAANWLIHDLLSQLGKRGTPISQCPVTPLDLGRLIDSVEARTIGSTLAKRLLAEAFADSAIPLRDALQHAVEAAEGTNIDYSTLAAGIVDSMPSEVAKIRKGNVNVFARLVGEGMRRSKGCADAKQLRSALESRMQSR